MRFDLRAWCALLRAPGVGSKTYHTLLEAFGSPEAFFHAPTADIRKRLPNLSADKIVAWQAMLNDPAVNADLDWLQQGDGRHIIPLHHSAYPPLLRETDDAPPLLFVHGDAALLATTQIAIVGSRNATEPARRTCHSFAQDFAQAGITVTSGLALGIDGAAHEGALRGGGKTIAVVGTGLDRVYPARHHDLAHRISAQGAIVSEYPIGTGVRAGNFPRRNRIISGLALGVLVVEASAQSGSLITARLAADQGREVFAIPGSIHNPLAKGCHRLIKDGAKLIETAQDVLEELYPLARANLEMQIQSAPPAAATTDNDSHPLLEAMGFDPCRVDDLVARLDLTPAEISAMLIIFELDGRVAALPGGMFQRLS